VAIKTTRLGFTVIITAALAGGCSGASDQGNQPGEINSAGGGGGDTGMFGAGGGAGSFTMNPGGGGTPIVGGGGTPVVGGGGTPVVGGGGTPVLGTGGTPNAGGQGTAGSGSGGAAGGATGTDPTADSASKQGTCTVKSYTAGIPAGQDYVNPTMYYPTDCPPPFAGVVVIPGFTEAQNAINQWGTFLASHGFAVMMVDTAAGGVANTGVQPPARATGLMQAVPNLKAENTRSGSPLMGKLNPDLIAIMGHSMGGGGTMLAANTHPELKAAIGLCPWNPGVTYPQNKVPSLFFDGTADILVSPAAATAEYQSIPTTTKKVYCEFNGGSHFVANTPLGAAASDKIVARIGLSWLKVNVLGDTRYQQFIVKDPSMSAWDMKP
jgi:triacylglycerol lipase